MNVLEGPQIFEDSVRAKSRWYAIEEVDSARVYSTRKGIPMGRNYR